MALEAINHKVILLVDDNPRDVELTLTALSEHHLGNRVVVTSDGAEALDYLFYRGKYKMRAHGVPLVVLLDNKMPKVNGLEVLKTIKADADLNIIPVVVLTSSREKRDVMEFYKHHASAYVIKPLDVDEYRQAVKQIGVFWAKVNEPPRHTEKKTIVIQDWEAALPVSEDIAP